MHRINIYLKEKVIWNLKKKLLRTMKNHEFFFWKIIKFMKIQNIYIFKAYILSMHLIVNPCIFFIFKKKKRNILFYFSKICYFFNEKKSDKSKNVAFISVYGSIGPQTNMVICVYGSMKPS